MREVKLSPYMLLGSSIRYLLDVREGLPVHRAPNKKEMSLLSHFSRVEISLENSELKVAKRAFQQEFSAIKVTLNAYPKDGILSQKDAVAISEAMRAVADILKYEIANLQAYVISEKRLPTDKLIANVSGLFGKDVYRVLPDIAQYDFSQAGKCVASETPTAAAFHCLRGTESVLRSYYLALLPNSNSNLLLWGPMVTELRKMTSDNPQKELLDNLDNIRVSFRNPTQHPEKRYDIDEAQDLFNLCIEVVNRMAKDLLKRKIWSME